MIYAFFLARFSPRLAWVLTGLTLGAMALATFLLWDQEPNGLRYLAL